MRQYIVDRCLIEVEDTDTSIAHRSAYCADHTVYLLARAGVPSIENSKFLGTPGSMLSEHYPPGTSKSDTPY